MLVREQLGLPEGGEQAVAGAKSRGLQNVRSRRDEVVSAVLDQHSRPYARHCHPLTTPVNARPGQCHGPRGYLILNPRQQAQAILLTSLYHGSLGPGPREQTPTEAVTWRRHSE